MDLDDSGIDSDPKNHSDLDISIPKEPIITFSPDRCRFDTGKSRNSSITSDFELSGTLGEVPYSSGEGSDEKSMTDLLTSSSAVGGGGVSNSNSVGGGQKPPQQQPVNNSSNINSRGTRSSSSRNNGSTNNSSSLELHKRLEKQIAQATMATHANEPKSEEEETEFGDWNTHQQQQQPNLNHNNNNQNNSETTEASSSAIISPPKPTLKTFQEFEVDEVEVITKCSGRTSSSNFDGRKGSGGLIPPQRLAIPHKGHANSNRKHSKGNPESKAQKKQITNIPNPPEGANPPGSTSENKPLVQWDSDESEEELSFFPAAKSRAKLTDNLSIDNMSLSGEEDDLHLSPPRHLTRKCPCDPRPWIQDRMPKTTSSESAQCRIT